MHACVFVCMHMQICASKYEREAVQHVDSALQVMHLALRQLSMRDSTVFAECATSSVSSRSKMRPICDLSSIEHTRLGMPADSSQPQ